MAAAKILSVAALAAKLDTSNSRASLMPASSHAFSSRSSDRPAAVPSDPQASKAGTFGLKLQVLNWEKELWDGVHQNAKNAFQVVSNNTTRMQTWTDQVHDVLKQLESDNSQSKGSIDSAQQSIREMQKVLQDLSSEVSTTKENTNRELECLHTCTKQLLEATCAFWGFFLQNFADGSSVPECSKPTYSSTESGSAGDSGDDFSSTDTPRLQEIEKLSERLGNQSILLDEAFGSWNRWRASKDEEDVRLRGQTDNLQKAADFTRERLVQWRDLLKESTVEISSLGAGLAQMRERLCNVELTQVSQKDVDEAIRKKEAETEELRNKSEQRVNYVADKLADSISEVEGSLKTSQRLVLDQVNELKADVRSLLEDSLNPVNAYLNTMHVNGSKVRMEVDELIRGTAALEDKMKDLAEGLLFCQEGVEEQCRNLGGRVDSLSTETSNGVQKGEQELKTLENSIRQLRQELADHLEKVHKTIAGNSEALENIKDIDIPKVNREFLKLEQKVAKWVRTDPMPTKISEARLYALEARLAHEMESRMLFEEDARTHMSSISHASSNLQGNRSSMNSLPALSRHTPRGSSDGLTARSQASSKVRNTPRKLQQDDASSSIGFVLG
jgi:chromosome segregation ATPase